MEYLLGYFVLFLEWAEKKEIEMSERQRSRLVYFSTIMAFILFFVFGRFN